MPDERQPGRDAPMWPTDDEDRGAEERAPEPAATTPAESPQAADQGKPAAESTPMWPTDDEESPEEPPEPEPAEPPAAKEADPTPDEAPAEDAEAPTEESADPAGIEPAESDEVGEPEPEQTAPATADEPAESDEVEDPQVGEQTVPAVADESAAGWADGIKPAESDRAEEPQVGEPDPEQTVRAAVEEPVAGWGGIRPAEAGWGEKPQVEDSRSGEVESEEAQATADLRVPEGEGDEDRGDEADGESTQRVVTTGEQPTMLRGYVEDTQVIDLRPLTPPRRPGPPPPSSPLQRPPQRRPPHQGPARPSGPPPGRVIPPVGPPRARPMRIEPRPPERHPEAPAERTEMMRLTELPPRRLPEPEPEPYDDDDDYYDDEPPEDVEAPPRRRRRKGLLITLLSLVVVLAVAAGVVFTVPGLADKLGLKGGNDVAIAPPPAPVAFTPQLKGPDPQAPNPTKDGVAQALSGPASAGALGTLTGIVIDPSDGTVLWDRDSDTGLTPASTGKLLTSAAALLSLDHTTQFVTRVVAGDEPGTVVLVGGGDLTLNSLPDGEDSVYPGSAHVDDLIAQVRKATGGKVDKVLIDVHRYAGPLLAPGWDPKDVAAGYEAPMEPVMMDGGRADPTEPETSTRSSHPARTVATKIADAFGATVPEDATTVAKQDAAVLGEVRSAPMVELIDNLLQISDNMLAEGVLREVAKQNGEEVSFAGGVRAVRKVLQDNGFDVSGYHMVDGSGLSTQDKATARLLADVLAVAAGPDGKDPRTAKLRPLLGGLPVAGGSGTLNPRFQDQKSEQGKGWVRAKTGTLTGVNTLAGVVLDKDGRVLVFALMSNDGDGAKARPALDAVAARLRQCGCG